MPGQSLIVATGANRISRRISIHVAGNTAATGNQQGHYHQQALTIIGYSGSRVRRFPRPGARIATGQRQFYDGIFSELGIPYAPLRWNVDLNPLFMGADQTHAQSIRQGRVMELINAYRVRGHLMADIDPLHALPLLYHPELDIETYNLTIWDLDRSFFTGGLAGTENATLREILDLLQRAYCGKVGTEYRHIQSKEEKLWLREQIRREFVQPEPIDVEVKKRILWKLISAEQFERFLNTKFLARNAFRLKGCETIIPLLDQFDRAGRRTGCRRHQDGHGPPRPLECTGQRHRTFCERIFTAFEGSVQSVLSGRRRRCEVSPGRRG